MIKLNIIETYSWKQLISIFTCLINIIWMNYNDMYNLILDFIKMFNHSKIILITAV